MPDEDPIEEEYEEPEESFGEEDNDPITYGRPTDFEKTLDRRKLRAESAKAMPDGSLPIPLMSSQPRGKKPSKVDDEQKMISRRLLLDLANEIGRDTTLSAEQKITKLAEATKYVRFVELVDIALHAGGNVGRAALERVSWVEDGKPATRKPSEIDDDMPGIVDDIPE